MDFEHINRVLQIPKSIPKDLFKKEDFSLVQVDLAGMSGQPSVVYFNPEADLAIHMCISPLICMDKTVPEGFNYPFMCITTQDLSSTELVSGVAAVLEYFPLESLASSTDPAEKLTFRIQIETDKTVKSDEEFGTGYLVHGTATVLVSGDVFERNLKLLAHQIHTFNLFNTPQGTLQ
jgi:hypothetical protein